jgi:hypothetical protein
MSHVDGAVHTPDGSIHPGELDAFPSFEPEAAEHAR